MPESDVIARTDGAVTTASLVRDLRALGVEPDGVLLVHSSLSAIGWVCGGAHAVVRALEEAVGDGGTLVMPSFSAHLSDPRHWSKPPVPEAWWPVIRAQTPAYDPHRTETRMMGRIVDCFRAGADVARSAHPQFSFVARGPAANATLANHELEDGLGEASPLARLYELDARVLLLGVGHERNSSLHLSEYRADWRGKERYENGAPLGSGWTTFTMEHTDGDDFAEIGAAFPDQIAGRVGQAEARLFAQRAVVDFGAGWLARHR